MHELSIAENLVSLALNAMAAGADGEAGMAATVSEVHLRVGRLSGVEPDSLQFCYGIVTQETPLAGSALVIEEVAVAIFCPACGEERELPGIQSFLCPACGRPSSDVRRGRELELAAIHLAESSSPPDA